MISTRMYVRNLKRTDVCEKTERSHVSKIQNLDQEVSKKIEESWCM